MEAPESLTRKIVKRTNKLVQLEPVTFNERFLVWPYNKHLINLA